MGTCPSLGLCQRSRVIRLDESAIRLRGKSEQCVTAVLQQCALQLLRHRHGIIEHPSAPSRENVFQPVPFVQAMSEATVDERVASTVSEIFQNQVSAELNDTFEACLLVAILGNRLRREKSLLENPKAPKPGPTEEILQGSDGELRRISPLVVGTEVLHYGVVLLRGLTKPNPGEFSHAVNVSHHRDLFALFHVVCLADAKGVYPECSCLAFMPKILERYMQIFGIPLGDSIYSNGLGVFGRTPNIGQGVEGWPVLERDGTEL